MKAIRYVLSALVLILCWKLFSLGLSSNMLPPPEQAFAAFGEALKTALFWKHFGVSAFRVTAAMVLSWGVGFPLGILMGYSRTADRLLSPILFLTYPIPKIVLLPIFLILFGLGDMPKILMIALIMGYQIVVATRDSVRRLDDKYIQSFRSLGGTGLQALYHVVIPAGLPQGFTALRIGTGTGIAVLFFVESFATATGLGFYIMDAWGRFDYLQMVIGIIGMSLLGVLLYAFFDYLEQHLCTWNFLESGRDIRSGPTSALARQIVDFGRMIKFSHTVFALPFALSAVVLAHRHHEITLQTFFWILMAMVSARSAAMGFNRIVDARFDRINPRTADRHIPSGTVSSRSAILFVSGFSLTFIIASAMISRLCFWLSIPVLGILFFYSYTKRFTAFSHLYLGLSISLAPLGAWIAITGGFDPAILILCLGLLTYIAGFDILYACQDMEFDREIGLYSIPSRLGAKTAFHVSSLLHGVTFLSLAALFIVFDLGIFYLSALAIISGLLIFQHRVIRPHDLAHIELAFFHANSAISILLFLGILGDEIMRGQ
jgi:putative 4-hydroxybenzoate polyprenyltransferase